MLLEQVPRLAITEAEEVVPRHRRLLVPGDPYGEQANRHCDHEQAAARDAIFARLRQMRAVSGYSAISSFLASCSILVASIM
jgi:hypothetical protein